MSETPLQSTLRELRGFATDPRGWAALAVIALMIGAIGPFGSYESMALPGRLAYWGAMVVSTFLTGYACATFIQHAIGPRLPELGARIVSGLVAGVPVAFVAAGINLAVFGPQADSIGLPTLLAYCPPITLAVTLLLGMIETALSGSEEKEGVPAPPPILDRLPLPRRGRLIALSVSDHYVEVVTDKGRSMVLMRLADAIAETRGTQGLQVHRSHWVALDAVRRVVRRGGRPVIELETGDEIPISRTHQQAAREAGLMP